MEKINSDVSCDGRSLSKGTSMEEGQEDPVVVGKEILGGPVSGQ